MGSDDIFKKRRAKSKSKLKRNAPSRLSSERLLIVCEGRKTEPHYFEEIRKSRRVSTTDVRVTGDCGSAPISVVDHAIELFDKEKKSNGDTYDHVYCVMDKDTHDTYQAALDKLRRKRPAKVFTAITSVPCFEYWFLLHFEYSTRSHSPLPETSPGQQMLLALKKHLPNYEKGNSDLFKELHSRLDTAKTNAVKSLNHARQNNTDDPSTRVHELVEKLESQKGNARARE